MGRGLETALEAKIGRRRMNRERERERGKRMEERGDGRDGEGRGERISPWK